jgi:hypothetical protein
VLAVLPSIIGGKHDIRIRELPSSGKFISDVLDRLINGLQALYAVLVALLNSGCIGRRNLRQRAYPRRLIRHDLLLVRG